VPRFLSDAWVSALADAAAAASAPPDLELAVEHVVTGGPGGEARYGVRIAGGKVSVVPGGFTDGTVHADATFRQDWDTAVAVHRGELSTQDAFMTGRLQVDGDVRALIRSEDGLAALDGLFAALRASTEY
jgi:hypothetical protein